MNKGVVRLLSGVFAFAGLIVALALSWIILAGFNFSYGVWHDHGGIGAAINRYGPENKFRSGFELTTKAQREDLFAGIVRAIHFNPEHLQALQYTVPGHPPQTLLTDPEVVHLEDVARLISFGAVVAAVALMLWLGVAALFCATRTPLPRFKYQCVGIAAGLVVLGAAVAIVGPVEVFYLLHTWVFPEGHAWFFYYQESLMSTMMYAPVLFGWIAAEWLVLSLLMFTGLQILVGRLVGVYCRNH